MDSGEQVKATDEQIDAAMKCVQSWWANELVAERDRLVAALRNIKSLVEDMPRLPMMSYEQCKNEVDAALAAYDAARPCNHIIIGTLRAGHCVLCDARFPGKHVQYIERGECLGASPAAATPEQQEELKREHPSPHDEPGDYVEPTGPTPSAQECDLAGDAT